YDRGFRGYRRLNFKEVGSRKSEVGSHALSYAVPLPYGTLRERGSKLRAASRREGYSFLTGI
ncbi:MAG: hypothetical protein ACYT04_98420, partial [Nostoc sp.]